MARKPGRPPNPTSVDDATMDATRVALIRLADELGVGTGRYPDAADASGVSEQPVPLELAALALRCRDALDLIAGEHVRRARALDGVTWEQVGERLGTSMQSAHARFRGRS